MNTTAAAAQAGVTVATVRTWCRVGAVAARKTAGQWIISASSLARRIAITARTPAPATPNRTETPVAETPETTPAPAPAIETDLILTTEGDKVYLSAPFSREANASYRSIGGRWDAGRKAWQFAARDVARVREVMVKHFGHDDQVTAVVDARVDLRTYFSSIGFRESERMWFGGRLIAERRSRDENVRTGRDVIVVDGGFDRSGGSMRYPAVTWKDGTTVEVRNVPAGHADLTGDGVTVLATEGIDRDALAAERTALLARLAEIDTLMGESA